MWGGFSWGLYGAALKLDGVRPRDESWVRGEKRQGGARGALLRGERAEEGGRSGEAEGEGGRKRKEREERAT